MVHSHHLDLCFAVALVPLKPRLLPEALWFKLLPKEAFAALLGTWVFLSSTSNLSTDINPSSSVSRYLVRLSIWNWFRSLSLWRDSLNPRSVSLWMPSVSCSLQIYLAVWCTRYLMRARLRLASFSSKTRVNFIFMRVMKSKAPISVELWRFLK